MKSAYIDLDGTLLNSSERLYRLFEQLTGGSNLTLSEYWDRKRLPRSNESLLRELGRSEDEIETFQREWLALIETPEFLAMDVPHPGVYNALERLGGRYELNILTSRQLTSMVADQLARWKLTDYFADVVVTGIGKTKAQAVQDRGICCSPQDIVIGDTHADVDVARELGMSAILVGNGFRCPDYLLRLHPDRYFASFVDAADHLV